MKANLAQRFRLYPDAEQAERLAAWSHTCRAIWNIGLAQRIWAYRSAQRVTIRSVDQCRELTEARREHDWLRDLPAQCAQQVLRHLDAAYDNFWNRAHPAGFPRFKKKCHRQAVTFPGQAVQVRRVSRRMGLVKLPKLGWVRFRLSQALRGTVRNATVSRDGLGWHVCFGVHQSEPAEAPINTGPPVGVDVGISCSVFISDEDQERQRPDTLTRNERIRLRGLEQRRSRLLMYAKKHNEGRYSNRLHKTIAQIRALKARQARRRTDWNHKLTTELAHSHGLIAVEDLPIRNMMCSARGTAERPGTNVRQKPVSIDRSPIRDGSSYVANSGTKPVGTEESWSLFLRLELRRHARNAVYVTQGLGKAAHDCSPVFIAGTLNTLTAMPRSTSVIEHCSPPDGREPPRAVAVVRRARAVRNGKAPIGVVACVNHPPWSPQYGQEESPAFGRERTS